MNQILNLTEPEVNLVRYLLEQEHDRLAKEMVATFSRWLTADAKGLPEAAALKALKEGYAARIQRVNTVLEKI